MHSQKKHTTDFCNEIDVWSAKEVQSHVNIYVGADEFVLVVLCTL